MYARSVDAVGRAPRLRRSALPVGGQAIEHATPGVGEVLHIVVPVGPIEETGVDQPDRGPSISGAGEGDHDPGELCPQR